MVARISSMPIHMPNTPRFLSRKLKPTASRIMPVRMGMSMAWKADIGIMVGTALSLRDECQSRRDWRGVP
ncbi:hypothetical protein A2T76_15725 [Pseudomonas brenneri]|nr:hypothetical protein A2T76_15725 [Pseudomonas brenneri]